MMKFIMAIVIAFSLVGCIPDISGDTDNSTNTNSNNVITDSYNIYNEEQEEILADGYTPDIAGQCRDAYFWCSIEEKCLPSGAGATCPLTHTDEDEAEASEIAGN